MQIPTFKNRRAGFFLIGQKICIVVPLIPQRACSSLQCKKKEEEKKKIIRKKIKLNKWSQEVKLKHNMNICF